MASSEKFDNPNLGGLQSTDGEEKSAVDDEEINRDTLEFEPIRRRTPKRTHCFPNARRCEHAGP